MPWQRTDRAKPATATATPEPPIAPRTHFAAGRLHESQQQLNKAIEQYRAAVALDPQMVEARDRLGVCLTRIGSYEAAIEQFAKAIQARPDAAHVRNNLAFCYISQRRWAEAEAELRSALRLKPDFLRARINLGLVLAQQKQFEAALETFRSVLNEEDAQFNMGLMYQSVGRYADAGRSFRTALEKNPGLVAARERLDKLGPLIEREERERQKLSPTAGPTTRPSEGLANAAPSAEPASPMPQAAATEGQPDGVSFVRQSSPVPPLSPVLLPAARTMLASVKDTLARAVASGSAMRRMLAEASRQETQATPVVICEPTDCDRMEPEAFDDLSDELSFEYLDPQSESARAPLQGPAATWQAPWSMWPPFSTDLPAVGRKPTVSLLEQGGPIGPSLLIGAIVLPDSPFDAFPHD